MNLDISKSTASEKSKKIAIKPVKTQDLTLFVDSITAFGEKVNLLSLNYDL